MKSRRTIVFGLVLALTLSLGVGALGQESLTGDEILANVDEQQEKISNGDVISIFSLDIQNSDGTENEQKLGSLAKKEVGEPNYTLIYFLEPENAEGMIILSRETENGETEMWNLLPAFGQKKKISGSSQQRSFVNSNLTYQEIGDRNMNQRYNAELVDETKLTIDGESIPAYVLETEEKEDAATKYPTGKLWVGKDNWLVLKSENRNDDGELERVLEVKELGTFEGKTVTEKLFAENLLKGNSTTVTFEKRERPEKEIPVSVFNPDNLSEFDPEAWGLKE